MAGCPLNSLWGGHLWARFLFSLFNGLLCIFWMVAQAVIISRALLIGEARLPAVDMYE